MPLALPMDLAFVTMPCAMTFLPCSFIVSTPPLPGGRTAHSEAFLADLKHNSVFIRSISEWILILMEWGCGR